MSAISPRIRGLAVEVDALPLPDVAAMLRVAADSVEAFEAAPPAPPPAPEPPPAPPPPPVGDTPTGPIGVMQSRQLNLSKLLYISAMHGGGRYTRAIANTRHPRGIVAEIAFNADSRTAAPSMFHAASYTLLCDGAPVANAAPTPGARASVFTNVDLRGISDGWHLFDIMPASGDESPVPYWMHVGEPVASPAWAPTQMGSFTLTHLGPDPLYYYGTVPAQISAPGYPLAPRAFAPLTGWTAPSQLYKRDLCPSINGDPVIPYTTEDGLRTCLSAHGYSWGHLTAAKPAVVLRDGPRGLGTMVGATHLKIGTPRTPGQPTGREPVYFTDSWRVGRVEWTGEVRTLAGYRHTDAGLELVGDWSAIPEARRGFHELWGLTWDERTLQVSGAPIPNGENGMEPPHTDNPVAFVPDSQNNRICRLEFARNSHATPPKVTEFITGMNDPWDVVYWQGQLLISERLSHRIVAHDATTGEYLRTVVSGPALSGLNGDRILTLSGTLEERRAAPVVGPEGLYVVGDWLYYGSRAAQAVKRINLVTGEIETVCLPFFDTSSLGSQYCKISVRASDGLLLVCSWESMAMGGPRAYRADGSAVSVWQTLGTNSQTGREGRGGRWGPDLGYNTAAAADELRLVCCGADYGMAEISMALPTDAPLLSSTQRALYHQGRTEYERKGYPLTHGIDGFGLFGYPLPWGESTALDYYLTMHGHTAE